MTNDKPELRQRFMMLSELSDALREGALALLEVESLKAELTMWKRKYDELLMSSIKTNEATAIGLMRGIVTGSIEVKGPDEGKALLEDLQDG